MLRTSLILLLAALVLIPGGAAAQPNPSATLSGTEHGGGGECDKDDGYDPACDPDLYDPLNDPERPRKFCTTGYGSDRGSDYCGIWEVQTLDEAYKHGQAVRIGCGPFPDGAFDCPRAKDVKLKITVIKSVAKALGLKSTTIVDGHATGPSEVELRGDDGESTYYFVSLPAAVKRKMKAKKVRSITLKASGTATGRDGTIGSDVNPPTTHRFRLEPTEVLWSFPGNCQGQSIRFQRHLTYGGSCYRH